MVDVVPIQNKRQWYAYLKLARAGIESVRAAVTSWTVTSVIAGRLDAMESAVADGRMPTQQDRERGIALGVMAVRSLDPWVPEYSQLLKELAAGFESWAELPDEAPPDPAVAGAE